MASPLSYNLQPARAYFLTMCKFPRTGLHVCSHHAMGCWPYQAGSVTGVLFDRATQCKQVSKPLNNEQVA